MKLVFSFMLLTNSILLFSQDYLKFQYDELWIDSLKIKVKTTYLNNNGFANEEYYYENGDKYMECTTIDGELNGISRKFYPNGKLKELFCYVLGFPAGDWFEFYEDGSIKYHGSYIYALDRLTYTKTFGDTLTKNSTEIGIEYNISEYKEGCWKYYYPTGKIERIEYYMSGKPTNTWYYYDSLGNLIKEIGH